MKDTPFTAVLRSEWLKVRTAPSLAGSLLAVLVATVGVGALITGFLGEAESDNPGFEPVSFAFFGLNFGQVAAICLGVLAVAGEYAHGTIHLSLAAVPNREMFYGAKLAVLGGLALAVGLPTGLITVVIGQTLLGEHGVGIGDPGVLRAGIGCGIYLTLLTLLAVGVTAVLRSTVGALGMLVPLIFLISPVVGPDVWFLPDRAGQQVLHPVPEGPLGAWSGMAVMAVWTAAALCAGLAVLRRRDA
ncbi:ABC transporter permease [Streptomyces carminius]|uniref:ABC transporter permease n=1 Tax=Streptomyces carminius TaxID=2665496 RepID=A0A2M8M165_9ACTN|nr:ABC transporter permease [Streptomyces carminius]PJE97939.1 ABC transporter permease [Streptomyces carminius]PJF01766.1 ABC transporter permease [Streptomyces carminius]